MFRQLIALIMIVALCSMSAGCGDSSSEQSITSGPTNVQTSRQPQLAEGKYEVQQVTYDDVDGTYSLFLLGANPPVYRTADLKMARLTPEEIESGQNSYLLISDGQASLHLSEDFRIEYIHGVTETRPDPQTGEPETVIVRRETGFWAPFAGALAGQALGSLLFTPQYYVPPMYQPGGVITGYGGYGNTYSRAVERYQSRYQQPPIAVQNRSKLRSTGQLRTDSARGRTTTRQRSSSRSTGSGVSGSTLRSSGQTRSQRSSNRRSRFGSGRSSSSRRSFSGRRR